METLIKEARQLTEDDLQLAPMGTWLKQYDFRQIDFEGYKPEVNDPNNYARNVILMDPLEVAILYWPPQTSSAIHWHQGFWGYVAVLEGEGDNIEYKYENGTLTETDAVRCRPGGLFGEPDGVIHEIANRHPTNSLLTAHFYYPPPESFDGMTIFDLENKRLGVLNEKAETASWNEPESHFHEIKDNAFTLDTFQHKSSQTHRIYPVIPKPDNHTINQMITEYYREQAQGYDELDLETTKRREFTQRVEQWVGENLKQNVPNVSHVLSVACGTGRRALNIRQQSGLEYEVTGVDINEEMTEQARENGLHVIQGSWTHVAIETDQLFDAATCLYAFGHIPDRIQRKNALQNVYDHLQPGAPFYMDVFNLDDQNEWGPRIQTLFQKKQLEEVGYERGDVFYKKVGGNAVSFLHYFTRSEIVALLEETGFSVQTVVTIGYSKKSGQLLDSNQEGVLFIKAIKQ